MGSYHYSNPNIKRGSHFNIPRGQIVEFQHNHTQGGEVCPNIRQGSPIPTEKLEICWSPTILPNNGKGRCTVLSPLPAVFSNVYIDRDTHDIGFMDVMSALRVLSWRISGKNL